MNEGRSESRCCVVRMIVRQTADSFILDKKPIVEILAGSHHAADSRNRP